MPWVPTGSAMAIAAVLLLRLGWGREARDPLLLTGAWALLLFGLICGAFGHGAWGMAMVSLAAMLSALACLAVAGLTAPPDKAKPRRHHAAPTDREPLHIGRRVLTFLIAVPLALIAALAMGLAARVLIAGQGGAEADANVATLFLTPIFWSVLVFCLMMAQRRRAQWAMLGVPMLLGGLCLLWGQGA